MNNISQQIADYTQFLTSYVDSNELPVQWFEAIDHIAFKFGSAEEFNAGVEAFRPLSEKITCANLDNRRLATAELHMSYIIGRFGSACWVELMETRPERIGNDVVGFEHVEFYYPNLVEVEDWLDSKNIFYEKQSNIGHNWINIVINDKGQELKINDRVLADIVAGELKSGTSYVI